MNADPPEPFRVLRQIPGAGSVILSGEQAGEGSPLVLLHGLSATRRNVVQGSRHLLRRGYRLIAYDARGHGRPNRPRATTTGTWSGVSRRCWPASISTARRSWAARWA